MGNGEPISIKIRAEHGCWCKNHSPETNRLIDQYVYGHRDEDHGLEYHHHETGPEIIAWLALGTAGFSVTKALIDLITAIINAAQKGHKKFDAQHGKLMLIIRDTRKTGAFTEEIVLEIYDSDLISPEQVKKAIEAGLNKRVKHK